jgi:hypothetical protein
MAMNASKKTLNLLCFMGTTTGPSTSYHLGPFPKKIWLGRACLAGALDVVTSTLRIGMPLYNHVESHM